MGPISWILFGALAGWVASIFMGTNRRQGCLMNIVVGVLGALIGGFLLQLLTSGSVDWGWNMRSFVVAVFGAIIFLGITGIGRRRP